MSEGRPPDLSRLPSMTALLKAAQSFAGLRNQPQMVLTEALRDTLDVIRREVARGGQAVFEIEGILRRAVSMIQSRGAVRLVRVINATGVVLHTGLGRSVLAPEAMARVLEAGGYCNLEIDLDTGQRGRRGQYAEQILCRLTGAEAAMVVNNNAAATMLALHALAPGREVIVSRGQLIEIGGSYRLPEVMTAGGAVLRDVGTTNKTHLSDYERAIGDKTAMIMHVHTSNYRVVGFTESPTVPELVNLAHARNLPLFDDLGSGAILDDDLWTAANEPTAATSLRHGSDLVAFSGDKLLGGPQAGILLGRRAIIDRLNKDPMARALRTGKLSAAALEATLELYQNRDATRQRIPILAALTQPFESLSARAESLRLNLKDLPGQWSVERDDSFAGGGSLPAWPMPTAVLRWNPLDNASVDDLSRRLRLGTPAVLARISEGAILFDLRTVADYELDQLVAAISAVISRNQ